MQPHVEDEEAAAADWSAWGSVPWSAVTMAVSDPTANGANGPDVPVIGWHKSGVPYLPPGQAVSLHTLDVWIPNPDNTTPPDPTSLPPAPEDSTWIVYIHGGAWRDPLITSASFTAAATNLLLRTTTTTTAASGPTAKLAGLVSLNYRLSPHPAHPSPPDPAAHGAKNPDHIADVLAALAFLHRLPVLRTADPGSRWILAGHSCGATLAFQAVMAPSRWGLAPPLRRSKPAAVVGFNGLYDLAGFVAAPPAGYAHLRDAYREFVAGAFGGDEAVWRAVCPATAEPGWVAGEWARGGPGEEEGGGEEKGKAVVVVLVQSRADTLVPWRQVEVMRERLAGEAGLEVRVLEAGGDHDDVWREGTRMAEVLWEVAGGLERGV